MELIKFYSVLIAAVGTIITLGWKAINAARQARVDIAIGIEEKRMFAEQMKKTFTELMDRASKDLERVEKKLDEMEEQWQEFKGENRDFKKEMKEVLTEWGKGLRDSQEFVEKYVKSK